MHEVVIESPSRLHFGLASFGDSTVRQYGGVGAMIMSPSWRLRVRRSEKFLALGEGADRAAEFAQQWWRWHGRVGEPCAQITVEKSVPPHSGLGTGTQLALSVSAAMTLLELSPTDALALVEHGDWNPLALARPVGRGKRSAIGTYGFCFGGLVVDAGKLAGEELGRLDQRVDIPESWRIVLLRPRGPEGPSGDVEQQHFARLPAVPVAVTQRLWGVVSRQMLPALRMGDCAAFGEAVYQYGRLAGECFAPMQGGPFATPEAARWVETLRSWGIAGVGQSSWGPTLFAIVPDESSARSLMERIVGLEPGIDVQITAPCNRGVTVDISTGACDRA